MKTKTSLVGLLGVILALSCKSPQPMLSNLHHRKMGNSTTDLNIIEVRVGVLPYKAAAQQTEKPKLLWELQDSLPHQLLKVIAAKTQKAEDVIALMSKPISPKKEDPPAELPTEFTEYKVRLVFSNIKRYFIDDKFTHPNTRLAYLNT